MSDHAKELRRNARKLDGVPCIGDVRAVMQAAAAHIEKIERRLHGLEWDVTHWRANHAAEVHRARVLKERPDMPLERVEAYKQIGELLARVAELEAELSDDHWPHGATVKLRRVGLGYFENHGWAKRDAEGQLITVCSGARLDESMWEVVQELKVKPARGEG